MDEKITPQLFRHLVQLAALELNEHEANYLRDQLNKQMKSIAELEAIPLDPDTPPADHGIPYPPEISPALRQDEWHQASETDAILKQVPELMEGYIVVPEIPHTEL